MAKPSSRVSRVLMTGPLAPFAGAYRAELIERGYRPLSIVNQLRQAARFSRWLESDGLTQAIDRAKPLDAKPGRYRPPDPLLKFLEEL